MLRSLYKSDALVNSSITKSKMDVVREFLDKQSGANKVKVSFFFQESEAIITRIPYGTIPNLNALELRKFWKDILDEFHQRFICDYNLVEWERLIKLIRKVIT